MGKASLQVFCAHLFFVFIGLALLYGDMEQLGWPTAIVLTAVTFLALFWVATREVRKRHAAKAKKAAALAGSSQSKDPSQPFPPASVETDSSPLTPRSEPAEVAR
jgi:Na+/melibiose symporter-like transporter